MKLLIVMENIWWWSDATNGDGQGQLFRLQGAQLHLCNQRNRGEGMNYLDHAKKEFKAAGWADDNGEFKDDMQEMMCNQVMDLLKVFSSHGHSGFSAHYAIDLFSTLAKFDPVAPLTGNDSEWVEVADGVHQNVRDSSVFKEGGESYWLDGRIFRDKDGVIFTNMDSRVPVEFPWTKPEPDIVDI